MSGENYESGITLRGFILVALVLIVLAFSAVWFMFPGPDTSLSFVSPSGQATLELGELCSEVACSRVAIFDVGGARTGCPFDLGGTRPLFSDATATWNADETAVRVGYADATGAANSIVFDRTDCTLVP